MNATSVARESLLRAVFVNTNATVRVWGSLRGLAVAAPLPVVSLFETRLPLITAALTLVRV